MNDFIKQLSSPGWWLGVVIVSILLNVVASYIRNWMDHTQSLISERRRRRLAEYREVVVREADMLRGKPLLCLYQLLLACLSRLETLISLACASIFLALGSLSANGWAKIVSLLTGGVAVQMSLSNHKRSIRILDVAVEALSGSGGSTGNKKPEGSSEKDLPTGPPVHSQ
jgi:hypothetical protein